MNVVATTARKFLSVSRLCISIPIVIIYGAVLTTSRVLRWSLRWLISDIKLPFAVQGRLVNLVHKMTCFSFNDYCCHLRKDFCDCCGEGNEQQHVYQRHGPRPPTTVQPQRQAELVKSVALGISREAQTSFEELLPTKPTSICIGTNTDNATFKDSAEQVQLQPEQKNVSTQNSASFHGFPKSNSNGILICLKCQKLIPASNITLSKGNGPTSFSDSDQMVQLFIDTHRTHAYELNFLPSPNLRNKLESCLAVLKLADQELDQVSRALQNATGLTQLELKNVISSSKNIPAVAVIDLLYFPALKHFKYTLASSLAASNPSLREILFFRNNLYEIELVEIDTPKFVVHSNKKAQNLQITNKIDSEFLGSLFMSSLEQYKSISLKYVQLDAFVSERSEPFPYLESLSLCQIYTSQSILANLLSKQQSRNLSTLTIDEIFMDSKSATFPLELLDSSSAKDITLRNMALTKSTENTDIVRVCLESCYLPDKIIPRLVPDSVLGKLKTLEILHCASEFQWFQSCLKLAGENFMLEELHVMPAPLEGIDLEKYKIDDIFWNIGMKGQEFRLRKR